MAAVECFTPTAKLAPRLALSSAKARKPHNRFRLRSSSYVARSAVAANTRQHTRHARLGVRSDSAYDSEPIKKTLDNLDLLLGIEEESGSPPRPAPRAVEPEVLPEPVKPVQVQKVFPEDNENPSGVEDRMLGSVCYLLPLMDGLKFSKFVITQFPMIGILLYPLQPLIRLYYSLGFLNIIFFFALYLGVGQNKSLSPYLRFQAMQAIVLDIFLILPDVASQLFNGINGPPTEGAMLECQILYYHTVFFCVYFAASYGSISALFGRKANLGPLSEAAERQSQTGGGLAVQYQTGGGLAVQ